MQRRIARLIIAVLSVGLCAVAAAPAAQARTYLPSCSYANTYRPGTVNVFCGDAGVVLSGIHWSSWGASTAHGRTNRALVKSCDPNCAEGGVERRAARITLSRVRTCPSTRRRVFTRIAVRYVDNVAPPLRQKVLCRNRPGS